MEEISIGDRVEIRKAWPPSEKFDAVGDVVRMDATSLTVDVDGTEHRISRANARPERYWTLHPDHWDEVNTQGVTASIEAGNLYGIVDERAGGLVAYAVGEEQAALLLGLLRDAP